MEYFQFVNGGVKVWQSNATFHYSPDIKLDIQTRHQKSIVMQARVSTYIKTKQFSLYVLAEIAKINKVYQTNYLK